MDLAVINTQHNEVPLNFLRIKSSSVDAWYYY